MARDVTVPDIGDFADVPVIEVLVSAGDEITLDQPLVTLESDKATMDVPAPFAGKIAELKVSVGDEVSEGSVLMTVEPSEDGDQGAEVATSAAPASAAEAAEEQEGADATVATRRPRSPSAPRLNSPAPDRMGREADPCMRAPPFGGSHASWRRPERRHRHRPQGAHRQGGRKGGEGAARRGGGGGRCDPRPRHRALAEG